MARCACFDRLRAGSRRTNWRAPRLRRAWATSRLKRRIMAFPLSRDEDRWARLQEALALYRLAFGQPRQEDMLAVLRNGAASRGIRQRIAEMRIDLRPPVARRRQVEAFRSFRSRQSEVTRKVHAVSLDGGCSRMCPVAGRLGLRSGVVGRVGSRMSWPGGVVRNLVAPAASAGPRLRAAWATWQPGPWATGTGTGWALP